MLMKKLLISLLVALGFSGAQAAQFSPDVDINSKTIQALIDAGSDPDQPHPLEHHFYCYSLDSLKKIMTKGESLGYRVANVGDTTYDGIHYWYGDLIKETVLDIKVINSENALMLKLASEFDADYDGWGTPVVE
ncbi:MAG: ribonuclease E inhibitor B [Oceanospirillaceae bacterium]|nr:ribonuclease E inhibitor B [Oceanospirillaceae bacterium]MBT11882.1 ribonuclease E inhibitor B [Oceanospirillaceae bacterium]|tara:strand:+ start:48225 stop:48626 length:402 start_codon:yes stop_codon:yes gene_type:complete